MAKMTAMGQGPVETGARPSYENEITRIIRGNDTPKLLQARLEDYHGSDIAEVMPHLSLPERRKLYRVSTAEMLSDVLEHLDEDEAGTCLTEMDFQKAVSVTGCLETDTAVSILHGLDRDRRELLIDALPPDVQKEIRLIASFDADEIGSRITTNCIVLRESLAVPAAMDALVDQARDNDNISTLFVVDDSEAFCGAVGLRDLITARRTDGLRDLIVTSFPYVYANERIDECIERLKDYSENAIPVLDNANRLLGVITARSIIEAVDDELGEDYAMLAGLTAEEDLREPLRLSMRKRLPWLLVLLVLGLVVSSVVGAFEAVVARLTLIMAFQSLILDMAGNVGTQSLAVTIRVLMDERLTFGQKLRFVGKEIRVGLCNGLVLGLLSFLLVGLYICLVKGRPPAFSYAVSGCIGLSLLAAMLVSSAVGTLTPLFFKKLKVDPAVASGPLITTVNDLVAVVVYYGLSWLLLIQGLHFHG